ncbi:hypothetical protein BMF35_a0835 [Aurantiacibacter gangjinensis]|nr:hypothetical protein BMF35_a0835 [Aurantiacibacter gangjinensis]
MKAARKRHGSPATALEGGAERVEEGHGITPNWIDLIDSALQDPICQRHMQERSDGPEV